MSLNYIPGTPDSDNLHGTAGSDIFNGFEGDDTIQGFGGNDVIFGQTGNDHLDGGNGIDLIGGNEGDDKLWGDAGNDFLYGGDGRDGIKGGAGNDRIVGGALHDALYGGTGADAFIYVDPLDSVRGETDVIMDFQPGIDTINIAALGYTGITTHYGLEHELRVAYSPATDRTYLRDDHSNFQIALKGDFRGKLDSNDFVFATPARVGYYEASTGTGGENAGYAEPITSLGMTAVSLDTLNAASLATLDAVFLLNGDNRAYSSELLSSVPALANYVSQGGVLIISDRYVAGAQSILPGLAGLDLHHTFSEGRDVNFINDASALAHGPGGDLTDTSLDKGSYSDHGYAIDETLPDDVVRIMTTNDPDHVVSFAYAYGAGAVYFSSVPLDYYLSGSGDPLPHQMMEDFAQNLLHWAIADHHDLTLL